MTTNEPWYVITRKGELTLLLVDGGMDYEHASQAASILMPSKDELHPWLTGASIVSEQDI